ncbi:MAG: hypothetical protein F6K19_45125 [Cyanothece sp. SIO1E1]|nr:hypothetical protein [Cyanothece sp. SIO1E1]
MSKRLSKEQKEYYDHLNEKLSEFRDQDPGDGANELIADTNNPVTGASYFQRRFYDEDAENPQEQAVDQKWTDLNLDTAEKKLGQAREAVEETKKHREERD